MSAARGGSEARVARASTTDTVVEVRRPLGLSLETTTGEATS